MNVASIIDALQKKRDENSELAIRDEARRRALNVASIIDALQKSPEATGPRGAKDISCFRGDRTHQYSRDVSHPCETSRIRSSLSVRQHPCRNVRFRSSKGPKRVDVEFG